MLIEVFGPGCLKCNESADCAREFLAGRGLEGEVVKVTDLDTITARGVMRTPAVFIDGEKVLEGRKLREKDLAAWFENRA